MSQAPEILATLQLLRDEAENLARQQHLNAAQERIHRLQDTRERIHDLQPDAFPPHLQQAYELSLQRAEIEWLYWAHRQRLDQGTSLSGQDLDLSRGELAAAKERQLSELPELPVLSLQEQESLLQALMCHAVEQYVDTAIAQVQSLSRSAA